MTLSSHFVLTLNNTCIRLLSVQQNKCCYWLRSGIMMEFSDSKLFVSILIGEDNRLINHEVYQDVVRGTAENCCMTDTDMTET